MGHAKKTYHRNIAARIARYEIFPVLAVVENVHKVRNVFSGGFKLCRPHGIGGSAQHACPAYRASDLISLKMWAS